MEHTAPGDPFLSHLLPEPQAALEGRCSPAASHGLGGEGGGLPQERPGFSPLQGLQKRVGVQVLPPCQCQVKSQTLRPQPPELNRQGAHDDGSVLRSLRHGCNLSGPLSKDSKRGVTAAT